MSDYFELPTRNDGGPAFPRPQAETSIGGCMEQDGMSLRDWFAGQALAGYLCANPDRMVGTINAAENAYKYADAMLAERKKGGDA